ncbi:hypothetical protein Clacol_000812 [Clathrus columnatus]|uniref:Uncharacterized protein n=1 Tax=Clathrus columnatus TaxID=1419009 RepID=A0AAV5A015_9AGAM|nr:hypothetical protein Clacol_000812 [Clathrus columnatus]
MTGASTTKDIHQDLSSPSKEIDVETSMIDSGPDLEIPTEEELKTLVRVADEVPFAAMLIVICEFAERFSYYATTGVFTNFIQRPLPAGGNGAGAPPQNSELLPGGLNRGIETAVAVTTFFSFWSYIMPIFGAIAADQYWGRFKAVVIFTAIVGIGHVILVACSIPSLLQNNSNGAFAGFMISILIIGIGTGGIKANVSPLVAEQYPKHGQWIRTEKDGRRVIVDANLTIPSSLSFPETDSQVSNLKRNRYIKTPAKGSIILESIKVFQIAYRNVWSLNPITCWRNLRSGADWDSARPAADDDSTTEINKRRYITWDSQFVDEIKRTLLACKVFLTIPADMFTGGTPNDLLKNRLRRFGIIVRPIQRITLGFFFAAAAMAYAAILQHFINLKSPCGKFGNECPLGPAPINVWIQAPAYILVGTSEITGLEYAYTKAPLRMKSVVFSLYFLTTAVGNAISLALSPVSVDPFVIYNYVGCAGASLVGGILFYLLFKDYDKQEDLVNHIGQTEKRRLE